MSFTKQVVDEINLLRSNPSNYSEKILKYKDYFEGKILKIPGEDAGIMTKEGAQAYEEAANYLKSLSPINELKPSKGLFKVAKDYLNQLQKIDVEQIDSIDINTIIDKYGNFEGQFSNLMEYGSGTPEQVVISLLVSDGDPSRPYREKMFNPNLNKVGIATGKHEIFKYLTIILYSTEFKNKDNSDDTETFIENDSTINSNPEPLVTLDQMISIDPKKEEAEKLQKEKEEAEKLQKEKEEAEKLQKEKEEAEKLQKEKEEAEKLQKEKEEAEKLQKEKEEAERFQREKEEAERLQRENEEAERFQREKEEAERLQRENEEAERLQREKEEAEKLQREKEEAEKKRKELQEKEKNKLKNIPENKKEENLLNTIILIFLIILILINS